MLGLGPWLSLAIALLVVLLSRLVVSDVDGSAGDPMDGAHGTARLADRIRTLADARWAPAIASASCPATDSLLRGRAADSMTPRAGLHHEHR